MVKHPNIRFSGFSDDWVQRKLGDIADRFDNLRVPITASDRTSGDTPYYGANGIQDYVDGYTHDGEYILVAEDGANDLQNYPVQYVNGKVWVNNHAHVLQGYTDCVDNKFLMNAIKILNIEPFLVGGGRAKLNADILMSLQIFKPTFTEQQKIGSVFSTLDHKIELEEHQILLLKSLKKGYLQKMFPKEGATEPEVRFNGFTDDWELRKLKELSEINPKSKLPDKFEYVDLESVVGTDMVSHRTELKDDAPSRAQRVAQCGDVFYQMVRPYQKNNYLYDLPYDNYVFSTGYAQMRPNIDSYFLLNRLQEEIFVKTVLDRSTGTSYPAINSNDLAEIVIRVPVNTKEQTQIGSLFKQLDSTITLHQRKLELLKDIKKGLMQQMFV